MVLKQLDNGWFEVMVVGDNYNYFVELGPGQALLADRLLVHTDQFNIIVPLQLSYRAKSSKRISARFSFVTVSPIGKITSPVDWN